LPAARRAKRRVSLPPRRLRHRPLHRRLLLHRRLRRPHPRLPPPEPLPLRPPRSQPPRPLLRQKPVAAPSGGDPHAGLKPKELPAGAGHKGKVLQVMDAGSYTYLEVEEKGKKLWVAALKAKVAKGDTVEFPDSKPMENFQSKALNRTFDEVYFAEAIRVVR